MTEYLPPGGRYDATRLGRNAGNAAGRTITLFRGLMQLAAATGDGALMVRTKEYFDRTLPVFSNDLGWSLDTPATADEDSDCACRVGKAVDLALLVGEAGFAEGYDYAERLMRGYLLPSQLRDPSFFAQPPSDGTGDPFRDVASRALGSWGSPAPYGHHREGNARIMFCTDVVSDVVPALCRAWVDCVRFDAQGHQVNLLFDRSTPEITIRSPYTHDALVLELKQRAPVRVRVPTWLSRRDIEVDGGRALPQLVHGYLYIPEPVSTTLTIRFPLVRRELVRTYRGKPLHVRLAGDKVLQMDNRGMDATFFDPIAS